MRPGRRTRLLHGQDSRLSSCQTGSATGACRGPRAELRSASSRSRAAISALSRSISACRSAHTLPPLLRPWRMPTRGSSVTSRVAAGSLFCFLSGVRPRLEFLRVSFPLSPPPRLGLLLSRPTLERLLLSPPTLERLLLSPPTLERLLLSPPLLPTPSARPWYGDRPFGALGPSGQNRSSVTELQPRYSRAAVAAPPGTSCCGG